MKYIVLDTETSGVMDYKRPADAVGQPRVAEVGLIYLDEDLQVEREYNRYVLPAGWEMEPGATAVNGLTTEELIRLGVPISEVLDVYSMAISEGRAVVAFGAQFDCKMMRAELRRAEMDDLFEATRNICCMRSLMSHAKQTGRRLVKYDTDGEPMPTAKGWPKLTDACRYFSIPLPEKAHGALGDARVTSLIFAAMVAEGFDRTPEVHHAKNYEEIRSAQ